MKAAICDDNIIFLEEMKRELQENHGLNDIHTYFEVDKFFDEVEKGVEYDLVFLDIDWGSIKTTGLDFGEKLYELMPHVPIILVTGYNDRFAQHVLLSEMNLIGYLTKPIDSVVLKRYLDKAKGRSRAIHYLNVSSQGVVNRIQTDMIVHMESHNHSVHIYTEEGMYVIYEKLSDISKRLPTGFAQSHKSFLVNLKYVAALEGKEVVMKNGRRIPISRGYQGEIKEKFFAYIGEMI